jgi:hypothetical protein
MSKSIKLKNNIYWDATAVTYNHNLLSDMLKYQPVLAMTRINDGETMSISAYNGEVFLFINSHTYKRAICLINIYNGTATMDVIFKNESSAVPTISYSNYVLSFTMSTQSRGYLFRLRGISCV